MPRTNNDQYIVIYWMEHSDFLRADTKKIEENHVLLIAT